ncbi:aldolase [Arthrobacter sp. JSM 101049]|uniref:class II aldolase/adducin family protein n=1 Tax=Arthrobacter sp. JSM 101049 TaxID=929097 RepID=UPI003568843D
MNNTRTRNEIVSLAASLFARGYSVGSAGNISVRVPDGYLMTPTDSSLGRLEASQLSLLDGDWNLIEGDPPSKEVVMHRAMYEARPAAGAVVHLHSTFVTALSCLADSDGPLIRPLTPYFVMRLGESIPLVPYFPPGSAEVKPAILDAAAGSAAVILRNHGSLVSASTLVDAVNTSEELEVSAQLELLLGGRDARPLNASEVNELIKK